ncbi:MAG: hypothetical protein GX589_08550 [Deltaproteobacteria bacterium]|nr:hypothetical protein [Deltaproteobacteria bacterium]
MKIDQGQGPGKTEARSLKGGQQNEVVLSGEAFAGACKEGLFAYEAESSRELGGAAINHQNLSEIYLKVGEALVFATNRADHAETQEVIAALRMAAGYIPKLFYMEEGKAEMVEKLEYIALISEAKMKRVSAFVGQGPALDSCKAQVEMARRCLDLVKPPPIRG